MVTASIHWILAAHPEREALVKRYEAGAILAKAFRNLSARIERADRWRKSRPQNSNR